jgi:hypothetical protein
MQRCLSGCFYRSNGSPVSYDDVYVSLLIEHSGLLNLNTAGCFSTYCSNMAFCTAAASMDSTHTRIDLSIDGSRNIDLNPATGIIHFFDWHFRTEFLYQISTDH